MDNSIISSLKVFSHLGLVGTSKPLKLRCNKNILPNRTTTLVDKVMKCGHIQRQVVDLKYLFVDESFELEIWHT